MAHWYDANGGYLGEFIGCRPGVVGAVQGDTPPLTLGDAQIKHIQMLMGSYYTAVHQPVSFTTAGGITQTFQNDEASQQNLMKMLAVYTPAGAVPSGFYWVAADNMQVPFTLADLNGLAQVMGDSGWAWFQHLQDRKTAVRAAATVADVKAVVW